MLFTQKASVFNPRQHSLNLDTGPLGRDSTTSNTNNKDPNHNGVSRYEMPSPPTPFLDSPSTSTTNESLSRLAIVTPNDDVPSPWSYVSSDRLTPTGESDCHLPRRLSTGRIDNLESAKSPFNSGRTFSFAVISSPESAMTDDVVPKVEEIDDDEALALESGSVWNHNQTQSDPTEPKCVSTPPTINVPRKRGRPRKHPLPVPGQIKVTKGRSKTGCITCRRRKKKCDETKPSCLNCQKNAVVCEGYPAKEIWRSGKEKLEEAARRNSFTSIPRGLPILIDGIETDVDRRFLDHFVYDFSRVLTLINDDSNPFKEILLPMAAQHIGLMHSLMCLSGSHLSARESDPQLKERKHFHFDRAISNLRTTIASRSETENEPEFPIEDPMIASTIALCLHTICEGETRGEYRSHMDAARYLLITQRPKNEQFRQFIVEFFQYHDVSNSLTTLDRRPTGVAGDLRLPDFVPHAHAGALLGILDGLFQYISEITAIRDRIRQRINQKIDPPVDYKTLSEAVGIDSKIRAWEPSYPPENANWLASQLYRQSTWVYLYRTIRPSRSDEKISQVVDDGLLFLDQLPQDSGAYSVLLMPLFLLGCSAFETYQRDRIKKGFDSLKAYSNLRNIEPALQVVEKVWEVMDTDPDLSWDWERIIDDMNMDFLIT